MKSPNQKIYYAYALVILAVFPLVFLAILPLTQKIKITSHNLIKNRVAVENIYADWFSLRTSERELNLIDQEKMEKNLLDPERPLDFIMTLEGSIRKSNLQHEIKIFTLSGTTSEEEKEKPKTIPFQVILWGSLPNFMHFLNYLENGPFYVEINSFQIKRINKERLMFGNVRNLAEGDIETTLNIKVYAR